MRFNFLFVFLLQWRVRVKIETERDKEEETERKNILKQSQINRYRSLPVSECVIEGEGDAFIDMFWLKKWNNTITITQIRYHSYAQDISKLMFFSPLLHTLIIRYFFPRPSISHPILYFLLSLWHADVGNFCFLTFQCRGINPISLSLA